MRSTLSPDEEPAARSQNEDLMHRDSEHDLTWRARNELRDLENWGALERAAIERREDLRATTPERRIANGVALHREGVQGLARIESDITGSLRRGSDAEFLARRMQEEFAFAATRIIVRYMEGR